MIRDCGGTVPRKLLVFDVEGTLFQTEIRLPGTTIESTIWQGIAHALGEEAVREEVATHKEWEAGRYPSYLDWMKATIMIHKRHGLTGRIFRDLIGGAKYNPGVADAFSLINRSVFEIILVSGGFRELATRAQRDLDIPHAFAACEYLFSDNDRLDGYNLLPVDFEGKLDFVRLMLREYRLTDHDWVFVGDGANDVPVAKGAPISVGYRPHGRLREVTTYNIESFDELQNLLSMLQSSRYE
jgi:phosphoserine phosphatase